VRIERPVERGPGAVMIRTPLPIDAIRGCRVSCEAFIKADAVAAPPHPWSGVKFMVHTVGVPDTWQQRDNLHGSFDWRPIRYVATIPQDATSAELVLGLEQTTGRAFFDQVELKVVGRPRTAARPVGAGAADRRIETPRLRGVMVNPFTLTADDLNVLARVWKANHVRWQLTWGGFPHSPADRALRASYDSWLDLQLAHLDELLPICEQLGIHVLIDLHTPPGGRDEASVCRIFQEKKLQDHFLAVWDRLARRYANQAAIWGYDLVNEAVEGVVANGLLDWQTLARDTTRRVRAIDPNHAIIVEPAPWGSPSALDQFEPLDTPGVVYSVHMYLPHNYTHQGVHGSPVGVSYPGPVSGLSWNKNQLRRALEPAIAFQRDYHVPIYIGEFSAIRWAPGARDYIRDVIEVFEEHGWDWAYHAFREWDGWSVEHGPNRYEHKRADAPTDRETLLRSWFNRNARPRAKPWPRTLVRDKHNAWDVCLS
jgi:endoglucanase